MRSFGKKIDEFHSFASELIREADVIVFSETWNRYHAIGIMEALSNVNIVAKLLAKLQEVDSSCRGTYNGVGGVIMWMKTRLESTKIVSSTITSE